MKRAWISFAAAVLIALALPAWGQIRGAPASVTSMAPGRSFTPGPPASVTSLGPNGFGGPCSSPGLLIPSAMGCTPIQFNGFNLPPPNLHRKRHHRGFYPVYVPYAYAYPVPVAVEPEPEEAEEPEAPAPTIFENRPTNAYAPTDGARYGTHYLDARERQKPAPEPEVEEAPAAAATPAREVIPVVLIYRDGHEQEVRNYAIVGQTLYDLGTFVAHKIPLAQLNLAATIKANEDRGVEFSVPASGKLN